MPGGGPRGDQFGLALSSRPLIAMASRIAPPTPPMIAMPLGLRQNSRPVSASWSRVDADLRLRELFGGCRLYALVQSAQPNLQETHSLIEGTL